MRILDSMRTTSAFVRNGRLDVLAVNALGRARYAPVFADAGRHPHDRALTDLVGKLATRSEAFRTRRAAHDVRLHRTG